MFRSLCTLALAVVAAQAVLLPEARTPSTPVRAAVLPRTSSTCATVSCPSTDKSAWQNVGSGNSNGVLTCYYYPTNQFSDRYYCNYSASTGAIIKDADGGYCPTKASTTPCTRNVLPADSVVRAFNEDLERRKLNPKAVPEYMNVRSKLAERKAKKASIPQ